MKNLATLDYIDIIKIYKGLNFRLMKYGLLIFVLTILSCSKNEVEESSSSELKGKWVETETRTDTITFEVFEEVTAINLARGKEIRNGSLLPKYGSGPYNYKLLNEKISLNYSLSSNSSYNDYYFKIINNKFKIGNFYESTSGELLTFEKLN
ncbi:hypothetical protein [Maribacter hydrothermalis]|uniref:Uncharacterized protein n=1 Tax=Maribacter hydrothermalis TaxID=1836467 RepID=A0A1B7ZFQ5_9FLAO|nr:hypothetical protein [Maribacter hydrothermalis]APQ17914.1 hypothetical protein BTR34_11510 [Maribacter hydrothermalis]OBR42385.1 hypothetical protein A9200_03125 [Maribacter hydrothermalis]